MSIHENYKNIHNKEIAIIRFQKIEELKKANQEYESIRKPAKIITTTEKNHEVQCDTLPF